jgi:hypothetical protein
MEPQTNTASTKDWLETLSGICIRAYIEAYMPTMNVRETPFSCYDFYDSFENSRLSLPAEYLQIDESQLKWEIQSWDILSDEALEKFEQELN